MKCDEHPYAHWVCWRCLHPTRLGRVARGRRRGGVSQLLCDGFLTSSDHCIIHWWRAAPPQPVRIARDTDTAKTALESWQTEFVWVSLASCLAQSATCSASYLVPKIPKRADSHERAVGSERTRQRCRVPGRFCVVRPKPNAGDRHQTMYDSRTASASNSALSPQVSEPTSAPSLRRPLAGRWQGADGVSQVEADVPAHRISG